MHNPIVGYVTDEFALKRRHPVSGALLPHWGTDIASGTGRGIVRAAYGGTVFRIGTNVFPYRSGRQIGIRNPDGEIQVYCHLQRIDVKVGQKVKAGQPIGIEGATGNVTGPHLHFEMHYATSSVANGFARVRNPRLDFNAAGITPGVNKKGVTTASSATSRASGIVYTNRRNVPVYTGTGRNAKKVAQHPVAQNYKLARIGTKGKSGSWTQIMWKGNRRWVKTAHVSPKKTAVLVRTNRDKVEFFANRGTNRKSLGYAYNKGYHLTLIERSGSWARVRWQGQNAWVPWAHVNYA